MDVFRVMRDGYWEGNVGWKFGRRRLNILPKPCMFGVTFFRFYRVKYHFPGEKYALSKLELRLEKERKAVLEGKLQSNIYEPDLVSASR